ncbi:hypothetical protein D5F01_LYC22128 [Larimichthys crocea]|uniref:Uncharacterized protein n=1 Tax=Larimichthys crocea TaxID=215358 RepID=A0A6G0HLN3_LARCR|nr:hypothetical protein D5F01_LYC22128 [Larimichthys crocea]
MLQLLAKHLREIHRVTNARERTILNNLATGRTVIPPGPCPVPGCLPHVVNVDKHLKGHKDLTQAGIERRRARAKRDAAMAALERLRASNPQPAMVSRLDLQWDEPGEGPSQPRECRRRSPHAPSSHSHLPPPPHLLRRRSPHAPSPPQQQQQQQSEKLSAKRRLTFAEETYSAEAPQKKKAKEKHISSPEEDLEESEAEKNPLNERQKVLLRAIAPYFRGRSRGSKLKDVLLGTSLGVTPPRGAIVHCLHEGSQNDPMGPKLKRYPRAHHHPTDTGGPTPAPPEVPRMNLGAPNGSAFPKSTRQTPKMEDSE